MRFCPDCGSLMRVEDEVWVCSACGGEVDRDRSAEAAMTTTTAREDAGVVDVSEIDPGEIGPTTETICPACGHDRAQYQMKQIRSADESETRFFTWVGCGHKWREDEH